MHIKPGHHYNIKPPIFQKCIVGDNLSLPKSTAFLAGLRAVTTFQAVTLLQVLGCLHAGGCDSFTLLYISSFVMYLSFSSPEHLSINCKSSRSLQN